MTGFHGQIENTPPETNMAPESGWLEDEFPFGKAYFPPNLGAGWTPHVSRCQPWPWLENRPRESSSNMEPEKLFGF